MAIIPTEKQVIKLQTKSESEEAKKLAAQEKQGKGFVNEGQGVIPESVWKELPGKIESTTEDTV